MEKEKKIKEKKVVKPKSEKKEKVKKEEVVKEETTKISNEKRNVNFSLVEMIVIVIIVSIVVGVISGFLVFKNYSYIVKQTNVEKNNAELNEFITTYEEVTNKYYKDIDKKVLIDSAINGMLNYLDQYTGYLDEDTTSELQTRLNGEYKGIGVEISNTEDGKIEIVTIFKGSPAEEAGLKVGDFIISLDGVSTEGKLTSEVADTIKGSDKTKIIIGYKRGENEATAEVKLLNVTIPSAEYNEVKDGIGYINISTFSGTTYSQVKDALDKAEDDDIDSLIIDVRNNTGGYLSAAKSIADLFLEKGKIIYQLKYKDGTIKKYEATKNSKVDYEIVVLINGASASASEILAAALKESYGAKLIGTKSFGKGTIQDTETLSSGAMIKYTSAYWLTPNGNSINEIGLEPDVIVNVDSTTEEDTQLNEAIKALE